MSGNKHLRHGYHDILRREILEIVPRTATRILDLGCGTGKLGKALKQRQRCYVEGIELNKEACQIAGETLDAIRSDNLNRFDPTFLDDQYDCLIFADILEHLISPWQTLKKFTKVLTANGTVIASIPNITHPWIISQMQKGLFRYEPAGILDITHLRFFTKTTIGQMFYKAGLKIIRIEPYPSAENPIQYHVTAVKPIQKHKNPLTTILILTYNGWQYTKQCIASIKRKTLSPYKILAIDNGSTDGTVEELRKDPEIFVIENSCNLGFGRGFNIGMECVNTPYFVLCNTDTIVTNNWLIKMIDHMNTDKDIAILGPVATNVSGPQKVLEVPYSSEETLDAWAKERTQYITQQITYFRRIVFFFTLFRSEIMPKIGFLDERYEQGNFEDDDYCIRAVKAGLKTAFDNTVYIHHYGSQTFKENNLDFTQVYEKNQKKFMQKWGFNSLVDYHKYLQS